jgi:hypothetical protein
MRRVFLIGLLALSSCSSASDLAAVTKAIDAFHSELNAGNFDQVYADSAPDWKQSTAKAQTVQLFTSLKGKLGNFISATQTGWHVNYGTGGTMVTVVDDSKFQKAKGTEVFTYRVSGSTAQLVGYNINSPALLG